MKPICSSYLSNENRASVESVFISNQNTEDKTILHKLLILTQGFDYHQPIISFSKNSSTPLRNIWVLQANTHIFHWNFSIYFLVAMVKRTWKVPFFCACFCTHCHKILVFWPKNGNSSFWDNAIYMFRIFPNKSLKNMHVFPFIRGCLWLIKQQNKLHKIYTTLNSYFDHFKRQTISYTVSETMKIEDQGWIKCGSREHSFQEMTRKIEEIVHTLIWRKKRRGRKKKEKRKKRNRGELKKEEKRQKEEAEIEEFIEEEEEHSDHGDDKLKLSKANEWGKLGWNWNRHKEECEEKRQKKTEE